MQSKILWALGVLGILGLAVGGTMAYQTFVEQRESVFDWQTYRNEEYGFTFRYPATFSISERSGGTAPGLKTSASLSESPVQQTDAPALKLVRVDMGEEGSVILSVVKEEYIGFSTKVGTYGWRPSQNQWEDFLDGGFENLCWIRQVVSTRYGGEKSYLVDANQMPESYPRNSIVLTDQGYGFGVYRSCADPQEYPQAECGIDTQEEIAATFKLLESVQNVAPSCIY